MFYILYKVGSRLGSFRILGFGIYNFPILGFTLVYTNDEVRTQRDLSLVFSSLCIRPTIAYVPFLRFLLIIICHNVRTLPVSRSPLSPLDSNLVFMSTYDFLVARIILRVCFDNVLENNAFFMDFPKQTWADRQGPFLEGRSWTCSMLSCEGLGFQKLDRT